MIPIIYYAHSMTIYGTDREREELARLQEYFSNGLIYNPNNPHIQKSKDPMKACFEIVSDYNIIGLAFSHNDRWISSGIYAEIKLAQRKYKPIYIIDEKKIRNYVGVIKVTGKDRAQKWARV